MKRSLLVMSLIAILLVTSSWSVSAAENSADAFYSTLSENEHPYSEYTNATLNIREKLDSRELKKLEKKLEKYSIDAFTTKYPKGDVYFFASIYENHLITVTKYAVYDENGKLLNSGFESKENK